MHLSHGERKHSTVVPLIGRVVLIHEEIDNQDKLAVAATTETTKTTKTTVAVTVAAAVVVVVVVVMVVVVAATAVGKQEVKAE